MSSPNLSPNKFAQSEETMCSHVILTMRPLSNKESMTKLCIVVTKLIHRV